MNFLRHYLKFYGVALTGTTYCVLYKQNVKCSSLLVLCFFSCFQKCPDTESNFCIVMLSLKTLVETEQGEEVVKLSPLPKKGKHTYLEMDGDKEVIGYVVPLFRAK